MRAVLALCLLVLAWAVLAVPAEGALRVEDDEVIFTLRMPGATDVFLVGDFNNWNATVEKMPRDGDLFEISLFMVEGTYYYKFVVDGEAIVDPDNPGTDPERGSLLVLVERAGGLILSTEVPRDEASGPPPRTVTPWVRYIGQFGHDRDADTQFQEAQAGLRFQRDRLSGRALLISNDQTWRGTSPEVEIEFNRGHVRAELGMFDLVGFDNDSTWASSDPLSIVGNDGVFRYNAGFNRAGAAMEASAKLGSFRLMYTDHTRRVTAPPPSIAASSLSDFAAGTASDTTAYAVRDDVGDSDQFAMDLAVNAGDAALGITRRSDRGLNPGVEAVLERGTGVFAGDVYRTREDRTATVYWARFDKLPKLPAGHSFWFAYGRANARLHRLGQERIVTDLSADFDATAADTPVNEERELTVSNRYAAGVDGNARGIAWELSWDFSRFDFREPLAPSRADVHRGRLTTRQAATSWSWRADITFTDQSYGETPDDFHLASPVRNMWLNGRDNFDVVDIVGIDTRRYFDAAVTGRWTSARTRLGFWGPTDVSLDALLSVDGDFERAQHWQARAFAEQTMHRNYYLQLDGRLSGYDKPSWDANATFATGWLEAGYRNQYLWLNVGWGFDPLIFDEVINEFNLIGRRSEIRGALDDGVRRSEAAAIGGRVIEIERRLEGTNAIELECIIRF